jgi:hypothetical protein
LLLFEFEFRLLFRLLLFEFRLPFRLSFVFSPVMLVGRPVFGVAGSVLQAPRAIARTATLAKPTNFLIVLFSL